MGTIRDLNELTAPVAADYVLVADTSDLVDKDKKMLLSRLALKGGTPVAGHAASWLDANTVQDGGILVADLYLKSSILLVDAGFTTDSTARRFKTITLAMQACAGGETIIVAPGTYTENIFFGADNIKLVGSGAPHYDAASGRLMGGTIIRGFVRLSAYIGMTIRDLGVDTVGIDGQDCIGATTAAVDAYRIFDNLTLLGNGQAAFAHGLYSVGNYNVINNIRVYYTYHGMAIHGGYTNISNIYFHATFDSSLIIKAKSGIDVLHVNVTNVVMEGDPATIQTRCGALFLMTANSQVLRYVNISNVTAKYTVNGAINVVRGDGTGTISECSFTNIVSDNTNDAALVGDFYIETGNNIIFSNCRSLNRSASSFSFRVSATGNAGDIYLYACYADSSGAGSVSSGTFKVKELVGAVTVPTVNVSGTLTVPNANISGFLTIPMVGTLTIAGGVVTVTGSRHALDTEAAAATDDLDTINGGADGRIIILGTANSLHDVTLKNGTGNIDCKADIVLDGNRDTVTLIYLAGPNHWVPLAFRDNQ